MRPGSTELAVLQAHAKRVGLKLTYDTSHGEWTHPWKFERIKTHFTWRVNSIDRVHFHLGNEVARTKRLKRIDTRIVGA